MYPPTSSWAGRDANPDYIAADAEWRQAEEDAFYLWAPQPPEDFVFNYEAHPEALRR